MKDSDCCPTCGRPFKPAIKICNRCGKQITRQHKWHFVTKDGMTIVEHRVCNDPTSYYPKPKKKAGPEAPIKKVITWKNARGKEKAKRRAAKTHKRNKRSKGNSRSR